jgi:hypothetical protein
MKTHGGRSRIWSRRRRGRQGRAGGAALCGRGALTAARPREIGSAYAPRIIMRSDGRGVSSNLKSFKMLQNASKCSALRLGSSTIHPATATTVATTRGDTQGLLRCRSRPVRAIQSSTVTAPIPFKPLQTPAKRCNLLQFFSKRLARKCNILQSNASKCFILFRAHLCTWSVRSNQTARSHTPYQKAPFL